MKNFAARFCATLTLALGVACAPIDQTPVLRSHETPLDFADVTGQAETLSENYLTRAGDSATSAQVFELPVIGSAIAAASALAFSANPDVALGAGVVGATSSALGVYYSPRDAAMIYTDGAVATSCIRGLALQADRSYENIKANEHEAYLTAIGILRDDLVSQLVNALDTITITVFRRLLSETRPNMDEILSQLKSDIEKGAKGAERVKSLYKVKRQGVGDPAEDPHVKFIVNIAEKITTCVAKAGGL